MSYTEKQQLAILKNAETKNADGESLLELYLKGLSQIAIANYENCNKQKNTFTAGVTMSDFPYGVRIEMQIIELENDKTTKNT